MTGDLSTDLDGKFGRHIANQQCRFIGTEPTSASILECASEGRLPLATVGELTQLIHALTTKMGFEPKAVPASNVSGAPETHLPATSSKRSPHSRPKTRSCSTC